MVVTLSNLYLKKVNPPILYLTFADKVKFAKVYEFEKVEQRLKSRLDEAQCQRDEVQAALERCHERMAEQLRSVASDRGHIEEAVALVEGAMFDREQALAAQAQAAGVSGSVQDVYGIESS